MATIPRCSVYNGTVLPNKPDFDAAAYPNRLILYSTNSTTGENQYIWLACSKPFLKYADGVYTYPADSEIIGFGANKNSCTWSLGTINKEEGEADYYKFSGTYVWSFMPIYLHSNQTVVAHNAGDMVTEWDAEEPTITALAGAGTAESPTGYWKGDTATALVCNATVSDGGTLSYKWYRNGTYVASGSSYTPSTATAGQFAYYCVVTNTRTADSGFSDVDTIQSDSMVIVVTPKEEPDTPVVPDAKAAKHKHIIGYVLRQSGVPMAELIAEMLGKLQTKTTYNLLNFGGYFYSADGDSTSDIVYSYFDAGAFPLQTETGHTLSEGGNAQVVGHLLYLNKLPTIKSGTEICIDIKVPAFDFGSVTYSHLYVSINMNTGTNPFSRDGVYYIDYNNEGDGRFDGFNGDKPMFENSVCEPTIDENGRLVAVSLRGTLLVDISQDLLSAIFISAYTRGSELEKPSVFTSTMTFDSYDDVKITILR